VLNLASNECDVVHDWETQCMSVKRTCLSWFGCYSSNLKSLWFYDCFFSSISPFEVADFYNHFLSVKAASEYLT